MGASTVGSDDVYQEPHARSWVRKREPQVFSPGDKSAAFFLSSKKSGFFLSSHPCIAAVALVVVVVAKQQLGNGPAHRERDQKSVSSRRALPSTLD